MADHATAGAWYDRPSYAGKVRDLYDAPDGSLVMVATDRLSAFDVVMNETVPAKGRVLTAMTAFWLDLFADDIANHLISTDVSTLGSVPREWAGRTMVCRRAEMLPIECIVRGYLTGSAWAEYQRTGTVNGEPISRPMQQSEAFDTPIFTPSTKAAEGHDINISRSEAGDLIGVDLATRAEQAALTLYRKAAQRTASVGILLADTKFEFGLIDEELVVCDEVITPDSSRLWPADRWNVGQTPPSFDKQPVRDYLAGLDWDRTPPPPKVSKDVIDATATRYREAYERISGLNLDDWPGE